MDEKIRRWTLRFPTKENPNMERALFDWPIVLQYDVKASVRLTPTKSQARLYPFNKPIKSLYFCSFVVSVLFAPFSFKVLRKLLYLTDVSYEFIYWLGLTTRQFCFRRESEVVGHFLPMVLNLPSTCHVAVRHSSIKLVGELADWIHEHPQYIGM